MRLLLKDRLEGIGRFSWEILKCMVHNNPKEEFIFFFDRPYDASFVDFPNVKGVSIPPPARHPILFKIWFDYTLPIFIKKHKIDVFFSPDGFTSLRTKVPNVIVTHDLTYKHYPHFMRDIHRSYYEKYVPLFHKKANHVIAVSEFTKKDILSHFGKAGKCFLEYDDITVAYNAVNPPAKIKENNEFDLPFLLYLGSIHPRKNIARLLEAYEKLRVENPEIKHKLVLAGRKSFHNEDVENQYNSMTFAADVEFLGAVTEERKWCLLKHADALVYISLFEGFGIPLIEAMHVSTPVICSNEGALIEVGADAVLGVNPKNIDSIALGMKQIIQDEDYRERLILNGHKRAQDFDWNRSSETIFEVLKKCYKRS